MEVGIGTAPNLELYAARVNRVIGIDPNRAMARYARAAAAAAGCADKLELIAGRAEALPLEDGSADAVIMTHVRRGREREGEGERKGGAGRGRGREREGDRR